MGVGRSCVTCCPSADGIEEVGVGGFIESLSVLDWGPGNEPVGQVFEETLFQLGPLDRQLLLFCATSSLSAVRWLVRLGASLDSCDANGTTCLHVACRAGTLTVVTEVMKHTPLLEATDVATWTPLHIAAHMGRREVASRLLAAKAGSHWRNARGQTPLDLCRDVNTLDVIRSAGTSTSSSSRPGSKSIAPIPPGFSPDEDTVGIPSQCEPECFFVNPVPIFKGTTQHRKQMLHIAALIFNLRPSYGLAFAVASGLVDSYTGAMRLFLQRGGASRGSLGNFLGEAFSLCTLIRFSVFDAMPLLHTGVLTALCRAFGVLQLPEDLMKIERLVRGLSHVWWRKHKALSEGLSDQSLAAQQQQLLAHQQRYQAGFAAIDGTADTRELLGLELWQYLAGSDALCQLMLSTVLLHWFVHSNGSGQRRELSLAAWIEMNRGIEACGGDVPEHIQARIHSSVLKRFKPELALSSMLSVARSRGASPHKATSRPASRSPSRQHSKAAELSESSRQQSNAGSSQGQNGHSYSNNNNSNNNNNNGSFAFLATSAESSETSSSKCPKPPNAPEPPLSPLMASAVDQVVDVVVAGGTKIEVCDSDTTETPAAMSSMRLVPESPELQPGHSLYETPRGGGNPQTPDAGPVQGQTGAANLGHSGDSYASTTAPVEGCGGSAALSPCAMAEGWVELVGGFLPCPDAASREGNAEAQSMSAFDHGLPPEPGLPYFAGEECLNFAHIAEVAPKQGRVWASLACVFLFLAMTNKDDPTGVPYAMADVRTMRVSSISKETLTISLEAAQTSTPAKDPRMTFVLLLADGRWQEVKVSRLDLRLPNEEELSYWSGHLNQWPVNQAPTIHHSV